MYYQHTMDRIARSLLIVGIVLLFAVASVTFVSFLMQGTSVFSLLAGDDFSYRIFAGDDFSYRMVYWS